MSGLRANTEADDSGKGGGRDFVLFEETGLRDALHAQQ